MRATAMYAKIRAESPLAIPSWQVLRSATIEGAEVLGVADRVGSLEVGKEADLILLDLTRPPLAPVLLRPARNLVANLVYAETGRNIVLSMVAGKVIYRDGRFANDGRRRGVARCAGRRRPAPAGHRRRRADARAAHRGPDPAWPGLRFLEPAFTGGPDRGLISGDHLPREDIDER
jgi:N-acyl-D-aspartate/D-glutamate deacylase